MLRLWISNFNIRPETDKLWPKIFQQVYLVLNFHQKIFCGKKTKNDDFIIEKQPHRSKRPKKRRFLKFQDLIFGRKQTNSGRYVAGRSAQSKILPKIFFIENGQKLTILSQKIVPPRNSCFWGGYGLYMWLFPKKF